MFDVYIHSYKNFKDQYYLVVPKICAVHGSLCNLQMGFPFCPLLHNHQDVWINSLSIGIIITFFRL